MSGETEKQPLGWTLDTLNIHLDQMINLNDRRYEERFKSQEDHTALALAAAREAVAKAETSSDKRFDSVNEFRKTLSDQTATFIPRSEALALLAGQADKIDGLQSRLDKLEGRGAGGAALWGYAVGALGVIATIYALWPKK